MPGLQTVPDPVQGSILYPISEGRSNPRNIADKPAINESAQNGLCYDIALVLSFPTQRRNMFLERARFYSRLQFITDLLLSCCAFPLAYFTRIHMADLFPEEIRQLFNPLLLPIHEYLWMVGLGVLWWMVSAFSLGRAATAREAGRAVP